MLGNFLQKRSVWAKAVAMVLVSAMLFGNVAPVMAYYAEENYEYDYSEVFESLGAAPRIAKNAMADSDAWIWNQGVQFQFFQ